jgi:hypothetical protein
MAIPRTLSILRTIQLKQIASHWLGAVDTAGAAGWVVECDGSGGVCEYGSGAARMAPSGSTCWVRVVSRSRSCGGSSGSGWVIVRAEVRWTGWSRGW